MNVPEIRYAKTSDGVHIAYQVLGDAEIDLVHVHGWVHNVAYAWEYPPLAHYYRRLASFSRLLLFDRRGVGLSDRVSDAPTLEARMDDIRAVMDAAGSERAAVFGSSEGGSTAALFAATYPERTIALIMYGAYARGGWAPDYPWGNKPEEVEREIEEVERSWGTQSYSDEVLREIAPDRARDDAFRRWWANYMRVSASPAAAVALERMAVDIDIRDVLPTIRVPTLVLNRAEDAADEARYIAERIHGARYVELPGADHLAFVGTTDLIPDEIEDFLTGVRRGPYADRVLATVLFTDIVGSTEMQGRLGDRGWKELVERHHAAVRSALGHWRGVENDTAGDGFYATFDGPARAINCALEITERVRDLGIEVRAGIHTGECEVIEGKCGGLTVSIGARVAAKAGPSEVLVSRTVKDLTAGSGLAFEDADEHELKGVPDRWHLYRVVSG